jgi:hypothetical protein
MARKSIVELEADLLTAFPDNISGAITPQVVRTYFANLLNAIRPAYGVLQKTAQQTVTLGLAAQQIQYTTDTDSDPSQTTSTAATGVIARSERGTSTLNFTMDIDAATNKFITFTLYKDGVATAWRITANGAGAGKPVGVALTAIDYADPSADYDVRATADVDGTSVTLSNGAFLVSVDPVNSYT